MDLNTNSQQEISELELMSLTSLIKCAMYMVL
jgi:hypothetical protein